MIGLLPAAAGGAQTPFFFSTGDPDGKIATATRPDTGAAFEIESADDFILTHSTSITSATFTGLLPGGATVDDISEVVVEIYRVFPEGLGRDPPSGERAHARQFAVRCRIRRPRRSEQQPDFLDQSC